MTRTAIKIITVAILLPAVAGVLPAEERVMTVEELYLQEDIGIQVLRTQALSPRRDHKEQALETLRTLVEDGAIAPDDSPRIAILRLLATDGSSYQVRTGGRVVYNNPEIRRDAAELLGEVGGPQSRSALLEVIEYEREPMVLSQAIHALGHVGLDDDGRGAVRLARVLNRENAQDNPDNNLMYVTLMSMERLAVDQADQLATSALVNSLIQISTGPYNRLVREQARRTLAVLGGL